LSGLIAGATKGVIAVTLDSCPVMGHGQQFIKGRICIAALRQACVGFAKLAGQIAVDVKLSKSQ